MKAEDIINLLPIVADRGWTNRECTGLRDQMGRCPLCALANEINPGSQWRLNAVDAMKSIGIRDREVILDIMDAADDLGDRKIFWKMAKALGVRNKQVWKGPK